MTHTDYTQHINACNHDQGRPHNACSIYLVYSDYFECDLSKEQTVINLDAMLLVKYLVHV